jgi:hypothetical protein
MNTFRIVLPWIWLGLIAAGCGTRVMVPPRIDLAEHEVLGVIEIRSSARGELGDITTRKLIEAIRRDQGMVRILRLGSERQVLSELGKRRLDEDSFRTLGQSRELKSILLGELKISDVRPNISISPGFETASITGEVDATLSVELVETATGASLWSASSSATQTVGHISVVGGRNFVFDAPDPERAYGELLHSLVSVVARDFQVSWIRQ